MKIELKLSFIIVVGIFFSACSSTQPKIKKPKTSMVQTQVNILPEETLVTEGDNKQTYLYALKSVATNSKNDPLYRPLDLNLPDNKAWLKEATHQLWYRDINKEEFIEMGLLHFQIIFMSLSILQMDFLHTSNISIRLSFKLFSVLPPAERYHM